jgi:hypothetical protein
MIFAEDPIGFGGSMSCRRFLECAPGMRCAIIATLCAVLLGGCTVYQTAPGVYAPVPASTFDRAWDAARGAAYDEGVTVTAEDRAQGLILGRRGPFDVTISVFTQADGSVRVSIKSKGPEAQDPTLNQRLVAAYNRRMGQ